MYNIFLFIFFLSVFLVVFISVFKSVFLSFVSFTSMCVFFCSLNALKYFNLYSFFFSLSIFHFCCQHLPYILPTFHMYISYSILIIITYLLNNCLLFSFYFSYFSHYGLYVSFFSFFVFFPLFFVSDMFFSFLSFCASHILCLDYGWACNDLIRNLLPFLTYLICTNKKYTLHCTNILLSLLMKISF
jgi:hypothetical protein